MEARSLEPLRPGTFAQRVLIVDDTWLSCEGLASLLEGEAWIGALDTAANLEGTLESLRGFCPDVVLVNLATLGSIAILSTMVEMAPHAWVIAIGVSEREDEVVACAEAGVAGYLTREGSLTDLRATVQSVVRGEPLCPPRIVATLLRRVATLAAERRSWTSTAHLTAREHEILRLIDHGLSNKEIGQRLSIEVRTVKNHVHNILEKLGVHRRGEAAARMRAMQAPSVGRPGAR